MIFSVSFPRNSTSISLLYYFEISIFCKIDCLPSCDFTISRSIRITSTRIRTLIMHQHILIPYIIGMVICSLKVIDLYRLFQPFYLYPCNGLLTTIQILKLIALLLTSHLYKPKSFHIKRMQFRSYYPFSIYSTLKLLNFSIHYRTFVIKFNYFFFIA